MIVANDAADPLTGPEILLVAVPQFQTTTVKIDNDGDTAKISTPKANSGLVTVRSGSVVQAAGKSRRCPADEVDTGQRA